MQVLRLCCGLVLALSAISAISAARADEPAANPLQAYLISDEQIAEKCQASIAGHVGVVDGKTQCETVYEKLRAHAQHYTDDRAAAAAGINTSENHSACETNASQTNCIAAGNQANSGFAEAEKHMVDVADQVKADLAPLTEGQQGNAAPEAQPSEVTLANGEHVQVSHGPGQASR